MSVDVSELNEQQLEAWNMICNWLEDKDDKQFVLSGHSGTGKSHLISKLIKKLKEEFINYNVMSFTGKAVDVLRNRGIEEAQTIHSTIYMPITDGEGNITDWELRFDMVGDLIIIDEYSMLSEKIIEDLRLFDRKILFVGDNFQLPPVGEDENFLEKYTNYTLTKIVRQAESNPVIKYANKIRLGETLNYVEESNEVGSFKIVKRKDPRIKDLLLSVDQVLCGTNRLRTKINEYIRLEKGYLTDLPQKGEKIMCLRNNKKHEVFNGQIMEVARFNKSYELIGEKVCNMFVEGKDKPITAHNSMFLNEKGKIPFIKYRNKYEKKIVEDINFFDYSYAITTQKSQGSQFKDILVYGYDGKWMGDMFRRWLYTAITRCEKDCTVIL